MCPFCSKQACLLCILRFLPFCKNIAEHFFFGFPVKIPVDFKAESIPAKLRGSAQRGAAAAARIYDGFARVGENLDQFFQDVYGLLRRVNLWYILTVSLPLKPVKYHVPCSPYRFPAFSDFPAIVEFWKLIPIQNNCKFSSSNYPHIRFQNLRGVILTKENGKPFLESVSRPIVCNCLDLIECAKHNHCRSLSLFFRLWLQKS